MKSYLIIFESQNLELSQAGFDVCLALVSLGLPVNIAVSSAVITFWEKQAASFLLQIKSLLEFEEVNVVVVGEQLQQIQFQWLSSEELLALQNKNFSLRF